MKYAFVALVLFLINQKVEGQVISPATICVFSDTINESSGVIAIDSVRVLTHNDSGDSARLFIYNSATCQIEKTVVINSYSAKDFEAITKDDSGFIYVADVGNNFADRNDLVILKIGLAEILAEDTVNFLPIYFDYSDQTTFATTVHNYDCEGIFHFNDSLFLFSKNHGIAGNYCKRYALPDVPGTYTLTPLDSIALPNWITDAAIAPDQMHYVLTSEENLIEFNIVAGAINYNFMSTIYDYSFVTKKEGVCYLDDLNFYLTDEVFIGEGGKLYMFNTMPATAEPELNNELSLSINHSQNSIHFFNPYAHDLEFTVFSISGQELISGTVKSSTDFYYQFDSRGVLKITSHLGTEIVKF